MATHYERLSTLDASFLSLEDRAAHMHVGSLSLFAAAPFRQPGGGLSFELIERCILGNLPRHPRLQQKLWWPLGGPPVWIDDPGFDASFHVRRVALPSPGSGHELRTLAGNLLSMSLDPRRPLWEAWIIEGIAGDRFALLWKIHHCMADGVSVRDILLGYLGFERCSEAPEIPKLAARPAPSLGRLHLDEALRRLEKSREASTRLQGFLKDALQGSPGRSLSDAATALRQVGTGLLGGIVPAPFNAEIGPQRRFDWTSCALATLQEIRKDSGAKINDVVLAAVCGAMRSYLCEKKVAVDELPFSVMVPVSMRAAGETSGAGNRVSNLTIPLPLFETNPRRRLRTIVDTTTRVKASGQSWLGDALLQAFDWAGIQAPMPLARLAAQHMPANLVVTNIPGPQRRQFLLESELLESFPVVPLAQGQGLGIALYSYNGVMHWGLNADRDLVPDLDRLTRAIEVEIAELHRAHTPLQVQSSDTPARGARNRKRKARTDSPPAKARASAAARAVEARSAR